MINENFVFLGLFLQVMGQISYISSVVKGYVKPNLVSHFVWFLAPFIGVFFQLQAGARFSTLSVFMTGFVSFMVFIVSILKRNGYWKLNTFDVICGIISLSSLVIYIMTRNLGISILFAIISDSLAYIPTIKKTWRFPETETGLMYFTGIVSNIIGLLVIKTWIFSIYSFSISISVLNAVVLFCIYRKKITSIFLRKSDII